MTTKTLFTHQCDLCDRIAESPVKGLPIGWRVAWINFAIGYERSPGHAEQFLVCDDHDKGRTVFQKIYLLMRGK